MNSKKHSNNLFLASMGMMVFASVAFFIVSISLKNADARIGELKNSNSQMSSESQALLDNIASYRNQIAELSLKKDEYSNDAEAFKSKVDSLESELEDLETELKNYLVRDNQEFPFAVPTSGTLPNFASGYGQNMRGMQHFAVDIWTTTENYGKISNHKGNSVYSACDGRVATFDYENGAVTILCDEISDSYNVPAYKNVYTYYGHLGNGETKEHFIHVAQGQRVEKGQFIGYQGDLSKFFPDMRNVHLHFQIWSGSMNFTSDSSNGPHNPCLYIGGNCNTPGTVFVAGDNY